MRCISDVKVFVSNDSLFYLMLVCISRCARWSPWICLFLGVVLVDFTSLIPLQYNLLVLGCVNCLWLLVYLAGLVKIKEFVISYLMAGIGKFELVVPGVRRTFIHLIKIGVIVFCCTLLFIDLVLLKRLYMTDECPS